MSVNTPVGGTEQSELVTVVVDGQTLGVFDTWSGGDSAAKSVMHRPGGMGPQRSYVTLPTYSEVTVGRVLELDRDWELIRSLVPKAGRTLGSVTIQPLDADGNAYGSSRTASGRFLGVKGIKGDSNSENIQTFDLEFAVESWA